MCRWISGFAYFDLVMNDVSSFGSFISIFGMFIVFYIIFDLFKKNNLFFDFSNNAYIIILNTNVREFFNDFSVNYYIFNKYSFFNIFEHKLGYFLFDRFLFNIFLKDFSVLSEEYSNLTNGITL